MDTSSTTNARHVDIPRPDVDIPRPDLDWPGRIAVGCLVLLGVGALAGGVALVTSPAGGAMGFDTAMLQGSPFSDYLIPGLVLGGLFGIGSLVVATMGLRRSRLAPFLAFAIGCGQMIWITVELAVIKELSFLHPAFFGSAWPSRRHPSRGAGRRSEAGARPAEEDWICSSGRA